MNGSSGPAAQAAIDEAAALATVVAVPVVTFDERRTTVTADQAMMEAKMRAQARRRIVDKIAAAVMLQNWLDAGGPRAMSERGTALDERDWAARPVGRPRRHRCVGASNASAARTGRSSTSSTSPGSSRSPA